MDIVKTEGGPSPVVETSTQNNSFKNWLRGFKARFQRKQSPLETSPPPVDTVSVPETQPYKSKLEQKRENEKLQPSEKIYFHTTTEEGVASVIRDGLIGENTDGSGNVAGSIGYPLYFGYEHSNRGNFKQRTSLLENTPDGYVLTVWRKDVGLRKDLPYGKQDFRKITTPIKDPAGVEQFHVSKEQSSLYFIIHNENPPIGKIPAEKFLAAIPLDEDTREGIVKMMIGAHAGITDADSMEKQISALLTGKNIQLKAGMSVEELSHQLVASIEFSLIRAIVDEDIKEARAFPRVRTKKDVFTKQEYLTGAPISALWKCYLYRLNVNDQVNARYYDQVIKYLSGMVAEKGVDVAQLFEYFDKNVDQLKANSQPEIAKHGIRLFDLSKSTNYYGASTCEAAYWLLQRDDMSKYKYILDT